MTREPIITPYDINDGEVSPTWRYRLETKITPASNGAEFEFVQEGNMTHAKVTQKLDALQSDVAYWQEVATLLTAKITETEGENG